MATGELIPLQWHPAMSLASCNWGGGEAMCLQTLVKLDFGISL